MSNTRKIRRVRGDLSWHGDTTRSTSVIKVDDIVSRDRSSAYEREERRNPEADASVLRTHAYTYMYMTKAHYGIRVTKIGAYSLVR